MSLNLSEISALIQEISPSLAGGIIQKIYQPLPLTITCDIRIPGSNQSLLLSCEPQMERIHIIRQSLPNPQTPPIFCQFLRSTIQGGRIVSIEQVPNDRILKIYIHSQRHNILIVSLTGRHSNILLADENLVILRTIKSEQDKIGTIFILPSSRPNTKSHTSPTSPNMSSYQHELASKTTLLQHASPFPRSNFFEEKYQARQQEIEAEQAYQQQLTHLRKEIKKTKRLLVSLSQELERASRFQEYGRYGELLKNHLSQIRKGQPDITVKDYYDPALPEIILPLDPKKDGPGNLKDYFKKHKKFTGAQREVLPRIQQAELTLQNLDQELQVLQNRPSTSRPLSSSPPPSPRTQTHKVTSASQGKKKTPPPSLPYRKYVAEDGVSILVGKHAQGNDHLTFKVAKPQDLWLHARGMPGSHVVIQLDKQDSPSHETLKDAVTLALFFSDLRKSGKGEVVYTYKKHVRKVKGQKAGSVLITQDRSKWLEIDQSRLKRLKHSQS